MVRSRWLILASFFMVAAGGATAAERAAPAPLQPGLNSLQAVAHAELPGGRSVIRLTFRDEPGAPAGVITMYHPSPHIALDFANTTSAVGKERIVAGQRGIRSIEVVQAGTRTRVVINLSAPFVHERTAKGRELYITLRRPETGT